MIKLFRTKILIVLTWNQYIYIISSPSLAMINEYKLGKHKGSFNDLITRYLTSLRQPNLYF